MNTPTGGASGGIDPNNTWFTPVQQPQQHPIHSPHPPPQYLPQHPQQPPIQPPHTPVYTNLPPQTPTQQRWVGQTTPVRQTPRPGQPTPYAQPAPPEPHAVLLALAEVYFEAAHKSGYAVAVKKPDESALDAQAYCKLVATGLGCLEAALQYRLQPRVEAMVRLRYAGVLYDETDNLDEAEDALNKGIYLAARNNLTDIKYSMQHLLARIMFKINPKVAQKMVSTLTNEVETLNLPLWNYSFQFLRVSLLMEHPTTRDDQAAIHVLQKTYSYAESRRDVAIMAICSIMEAMLFLLSGVDGVEVAQRALSNAFAQQNSNHPMPQQIAVLAQVLDIICAVMTGRSNEGEMKLKTLHNMLDQSERWVSWRHDGEFRLPIYIRNSVPVFLKMRWLGKDDVFTLGYFLSGLTKYQKNLEENGKAERFLNEGLVCIDRITEHANGIPASLSAAQAKLTWKRTLKAHMLTYYCFIICLRTDWDKAVQVSAQLQPLAESLPLTSTPLGNLITYLSGTVAHGTGDLYNALVHYSNLINTLSPDSELSIIAKLNSVLILRSSDQQQAEYLMSTLEPRCLHHRNEHIKAAFIAVKSSQRGELVKTKNLLSLALRCASGASNHQLTFIILSFMCQRFFQGVVSEQAEKSARAALQNANKGRDNLWSYVAGEMYADCLARKGNVFEEQKQRQMNADNAAKVVQNLTRHMPADEMAFSEQGLDGMGLGMQAPQQQFMPQQQHHYTQHLPPPPQNQQLPQQQQPVYTYPQYPPPNHM